MCLVGGCGTGEATSNEATRSVADCVCADVVGFWWNAGAGVMMNDVKLGQNAAAGKFDEK